MVEFPVELWMKVFHKLPAQDLVELSRTCIFFHTIAQGQIFETVKLLHNPTIHPSNLPPSRHTLKMWRFSQSFQDRPELAGSVRTLEFSLLGQIILGSCEDFPVLARLHLFSNLQSITIGAFVIGTDTCSVIQALPNLKFVHFDTCWIDNRVKETHVGPVPARLLDLSLWNPQSDDVWKSLFPAGFKSFAIGTYERGDGPGSFVEKVLKHFTLTDIASSLVTLVFLENIPVTATQFLETLPQLRHIYLPDSQSSINFLYSLPASAIPFLETFSGPAQLCDVFIRGRPVHSAQVIMRSDAPDDILRALRFSTVPVRDLHFLFDKRPDVSAPMMGTLLQHVPDTIHCLRWNFVGTPLLQKCKGKGYPRHWDPVGKASFLSCVPFLDRFSGLHTLYGSVIDPLEVSERDASRLNPEDFETDIGPGCQEELVQACADASTSLRLVVFKGKERDGKWLRRADNKWEHYTVEYV